jgi:hypothetical protein
MERKEFYKQLKSFLKELVVVFPEEDDELQTIATSINLAIIDDDANDIIIAFYRTLNPYQKEIVEQNTILFDKIQWDQTTYEYRLFTKIKSDWNTFTDNNKNVIWEYINVIYSLSRAFLAVNGHQYNINLI